MPRPSSYSSLTTVQECERKFAYKYIYRLKAEDREGPALITGSWWHAVRAADAIRRGADHGSLIDCCQAITTTDDGPTFTVSSDRATTRVHGMDPTSELLGQAHPLAIGTILWAATDWWSRQSPEFVEDYVEYHGVPLPQHLTNLWQRHVERWGDAMKRERPILVESEWTRPLGKGDDAIMLGGRIDEVYLDTRKGIVIVRDWKSHGSWPSVSDAVLDLMDAQIHLYAWGASSLLSDTEHSVAAVEYDRVRTKFPSTPQWTKSGNMSKSTTDYDLWTYLRTIRSGEATYERYKKNIPAEELDALDDPKDWKSIAEVTVTEPDPDVIEELSSREARDSFFRRGPKPINVSVVRSHLLSLDDAHKRGEVVREKVAAGKEIPRSMGRHCQWCDFLALCRAEMFGKVDPNADPSTFGLKNLPAEVDSAESTD